MKITLYTSYLKLVLTYGCETWATTKGDYSKLNTTEINVLRKIFGPAYNMETRIYERILTYKIYMKDQLYYRIAEARGYNGFDTFGG